MAARALVLNAERRFVASALVFGHGTDNVRDEDVLLVFHALQLPINANEALLDQIVDDVGRCAVEDIVSQRIATYRR